MRLTVIPLVLAALAIFCTWSAQAADPAAPLSDAEKGAIKEVVKSYLTQERPETVLEAIQELKRKDESVAQEKLKESISSKKKELFEDSATPTGGNPKGDVSVVEFFDYQCGYCKVSMESIEKLLKDDKNVRIVYKEFPVLGALSVKTAHAAIASLKQDKGKYETFHNALMKKQGHFTKEEEIFEIAKKVGLNVDKLKKDMQDESVKKQVQASLDLGTAIGVRGTPMFVIGDQGYPGAMSDQQLKEAVKSVREAAKKK